MDPQSKGNERKGKLDGTACGFGKVSCEKRRMGCRDFENDIGLADAGEIGGEFDSQDGKKDALARQKEIVDGLLDRAQVVLVALKKSPSHSRALQVVEGPCQQQDPPAQDPPCNSERGKKANRHLPTDPPQPNGCSKFKQRQQ